MVVLESNETIPSSEPSPVPGTEAANRHRRVVFLAACEHIQGGAIDERNFRKRQRGVVVVTGEHTLEIGDVNRR